MGKCLWRSVMNDTICLHFMEKKINKPRVTVIIPSVNEDKIIKKIVADCYKITDFTIDVFVIVDSKTTKQTITEASKSQAKVINIGKGQGKGYAIARAIPFVKNDYVLQIDADYQFVPSDISKLLEPLFHGYDVTLGTRYQKGADVEKGSVSFIKLLGSYGLSFVTSIFAGQRITDVMAGFKAFKTPVLRKLDPRVNHFGYEAELVIKAAQQKYKIKNVPIMYKKRTEGNSNVASLKHGLLVLETIITVGVTKK
jgi:glycosyltransferase involved in cell wall biosynthesis